MKYQQGSIGRVFVVKMEHGDDLLKELKGLIVKENIKAAGMYLIGALKNSSMVTGPKECTTPPEPMWKKFKDCREVIGIGTVFHDDEEPVIHLHSSLGKGDISLTGCIRGDTEVYLVVEVIILEFNGISAVREIDEALGVKVLNLK